MWVKRASPQHSQSLHQDFWCRHKTPKERTLPCSLPDSSKLFQTVKDNNSWNELLWHNKCTKLGWMEEVTSSELWRCASSFYLLLYHKLKDGMRICSIGVWNETPPWHALLCLHWITAVFSYTIYMQIHIHTYRKKNLIKNKDQLPAGGNRYIQPNSCMFHQVCIKYITVQVCMHRYKDTLLHTGKSEVSSASAN